MRGEWKTGNKKAAEPDVMHAYCARCRHRHVFVRASINHWFHFFLSVVTLGAWLVSWVAICVGNLLRPWRCEHCGWHKPEFRMHHDVAEPLRQKTIQADTEVYVSSRINA